MTVGDMSDFPTAGHLASYAGLSPKTNQSGTSIMSNSLNRAGNKKLKNAPQAIVFCIDQIPRAFTTILRTKAKRRHNAAVVALARRRLNDLFAMMKNHEFYREPPVGGRRRINAPLPANPIGNPNRLIPIARQNNTTETNQTS